MYNLFRQIIFVYQFKSFSVFISNIRKTVCFLRKTRLILALDKFKVHGVWTCMCPRVCSTTAAVTFTPLLSGITGRPNRLKFWPPTNKTLLNSMTSPTFASTHFPVTTRSKLLKKIKLTRIDNFSNSGQTWFYLEKYAILGKKSSFSVRTCLYNI